MPYLPIDVDGKKKWAAVANGCRIPVANVAMGFTDLWEGVWLTKRDSVNSLQLECLFGATDGARVGAVLEAFGFLESLGEGVWRVRGAQRWLGVMGAKSEAGSISAARPRDAKGRLLPSTPPTPVQQVLEPPSNTPPTDAQLLHPDPKLPAGSPPASAEGAGWQELVAALFEVFQAKRKSEPKPRKRDFKALKELRQRVDDDIEIAARWARGLDAQFKQRVDSFWDLNERWDSLTAAGPSGPPPAKDARFVRAQDVNKAAFEKVGVAHDF